MKDFISIISNHAENNSERIAVTEANRKVSYGEFFALYTSISNQLLLVSDSPKVLIDLTQGVEAYALIIATMNIGGIFCPLNPDAPPERKKQILNEFQPDIVVSKQGTTFQSTDHPNIVLIDSLVSRKNLTVVKKNYDPESTIYVIYTSGSTGMPKGVRISRKALNKFLEWSISTYGANENDVWGQFSLLSFDLSLVDIFTCLCSGATLLVMADSASKLRPSSAIEKNKITIWHSIPSAVEFMIKSEQSKTGVFSSLRIMSFCGEPLRKHQVEFLFSKNKSLLIFNTYGPTEGTLFCTCQKLTVNNYLTYCNTTLSIGQPINGWNFTYNQADGVEEKEVLIYGEFIGQGYLAEVPDNKFKKILIGDAKVNAFETGDLVIEKDGNLYFSGRKDRQIKLNGYRIEPDEIDYFNAEFFKKPSVTLLHNNALYSFVETVDPIAENEIRAFLSKRIESYKIPRFFIAVREIPRNSNFKVNHSELLKLLQ